jgi:hypothetical protein
MILFDNMINAKLARQINLMAKKDQLMRNNAQKTGNWDKSVDKNNTIILRRIIKDYGWPTINLVGKKASNNAWLLATR